MIAPITPKARTGKLLLALLREISFKKVPGGLVEQFFLGTGRQRSMVSGGFGITWWRSQRYERIVNALAKAVCEQHRALLLRREDARTAIETALRDNELNELLPFPTFNASTLFHVYEAAGLAHVVVVLWERICREVEATTDDWLVAYPLCSIQVDEFAFESESAWIVPCGGSRTLEKLSDQFPNLRELSLESGALSGDISICDAPIRSWLFVRGTGSQGSVESTLLRRSAVLLGALMSAYRQAEPLAFACSAASTARAIVLLSKTGGATMVHGSSALIHPALGSPSIPLPTIQRTDEWLRRTSSLPILERRRAQTAARWINQAPLVRRDVRFLFLFFALDAMFGERFKVEDSIVEGVRRFCGDADAHKCRWLFDLRSELVHGGAGSVDEWAMLDRYRDHFQTEPGIDVESVASQCLLEFVERSRI